MWGAGRGLQGVSRSCRRLVQGVGCKAIARWALGCRAGVRVLECRASGASPASGRSTGLTLIIMLPRPSLPMCFLAAAQGTCTSLATATTAHAQRPACTGRGSPHCPHPLSPPCRPHPSHRHHRPALPRLPLLHRSPRARPPRPLRPPPLRPPVSLPPPLRRVPSTTAAAPVNRLQPAQGPGRCRRRPCSSPRLRHLSRHLPNRLASLMRHPKVCFRRRFSTHDHGQV